MARHGRFTAFLVLGVLVAVLGGCSGGGGSDVTVNPPPGGTVALNAQSQVCAQCHSAEISPAFFQGGVPIAGSPTIVEEYARSAHNTENAATCGSCHKPELGHPNPTTAISNPDASGICLDCHNGMGLPHFNPTADFTATPSTQDRKPAQYVDAALTTPTATLFPVTPISQQGCRACHNPHDVTTRLAIFRDYSQNSGHGDVNGEGWIHYRWKGANRAACQRCHTTSAFISLITGGPSSLTFAENDDTKQTLYCIGCHTNYTYALRATGAVTNDYGDNVIVTFPDIGRSNLCMNCHTGRENGDSIKNVPATGAGFSNRGFVNSHYLTGGATLYASSGYEYDTVDPARTYGNSSGFLHDDIGSSAFPATGDGGPCVGCHMNPARHTFKPVTLSAGTGSRTITGIVSNACAVCHTQNSGLTPITVENMNAEKDSFEAALQALQTILATNTLRPLFFGADNPYFFIAPFVAGGQNTSVTNWLSEGDADNTGNTTGRSNMGAAFNLNLFRHDYGAFTHNRLYVKRLIYDSIDWINDNLLDNDVEATISSLPEGTTDYTISAAQKAAAITYLLGGPGGLRP